MICQNEQKLFMSGPRDYSVGAHIYHVGPLFISTSTYYILWITFIFGSCHCIWTAATPLNVMMTSSNGNLFRVTGTLWGIHRSPVNFPHKGQCHGALMCSLICSWTNGWVNNRDAGDLRRYCAHYDVIVMMNVCNSSNVFWQCWKIREITERRELAKLPDRWDFFHLRLFIGISIAYMDILFVRIMWFPIVYPYNF